MDLDNCSAVITGASAGIGREFARQLASRAKLLILVARRRDRLEQLRTELVARNPALLVNIRETDLSNLEQTMQLAALLTNEPIDFLINNAGVGDHGTFATADPIHVNEASAGERAGVNRADSRGTAADDRAKTGGNFEREFLCWIPPATRHCGLRGHKSLRYQFFRSGPGRNAGLRDYCDSALPGAGGY
jgi:Short-chain dehydrogenases of various substrate specificities